MSSFLRHAVTPLDHVSAEVLAFPLASEAALQLAATHLDPRAGKDHRTGELWGRFELDVFPGLRGVTVDEITGLRDQVWFDGDRPGAVPLHAYLVRHAGG